MKHHEAVVLATDLKDRIKIHLNKGYALQQKGLGLETYAEAIRFNAVADDILTTHKKNTVSIEQFGESDINERIVSLESFLGDLVKFIRRRSQKKDQPQTKTEREEYTSITELMQWLEKSDDGLKNHTQKEGQITITGRVAAIFADIKGPVKPALEKELNQYQIIHRTIESGLRPILSHMSKMEKGLDRFMGNVDKPQEFIDFLTAFAKTEPKAFFDTFKEPSHAFLGYEKGGWFIYTSYMEESLNTVKSANVPYPTVDELKAIHAIATKLASFYIDVDMYCDELPLGFDFSDPPFRGYSDESEVQEWTNNTWTLQPRFEEENTDIAKVLNGRLEILLRAVIQYLKKALA